MSTVSIARCETYRSADVSAAIDAALSPLGGMAAFVSPGSKVLLKINLLSKAVPERAVTTHPEIVRAVIRSARAAGGVVTVGDSPGGVNSINAMRKLWDETGIAAVCAEEGVELVLFDDDCVRQSAEDSELFSTFTLGRAVVETDVLITLPKFKTHGFMMFTGAVKNLFGCIPGLEKAQYHLKVPDRDDFGGMLVDLMLGAVLASSDCVALDVIASSMAGLAPNEVYTNKAAARRRLGPATAEEIEVLGVDWHELAMADFELPAVDPSARMPAWLGKRLRNWATPRPVLERAHKCTRCKKCEQNCPVDAILVGSSGPVFDNSLCIRCYCCQELCPEQAIGLTTPPLARFAQRGRTF